METLEALE